ncbi:EKC/KEOPS complex subunit TP53RK [Diorhabda sublineata]|uniref:EKC/KEOPS complex subunit TP53RK n=1 Tax=Diorhabda sublineata TaxID=1163346 RepID=UPI0024E04C84|nr:EKC/KEOPS complex subunit TP53RK [Diorhabda sublineata]
MDNLKNFELIKQGAEAKIYQGIYLGKSTIAKERFTKNYRHPVLDTNLTKERMKSESRALVRCKIAGIRTPTIYLVDFDRRIIFMELIEHSKTVKDFIEENTTDETKLAQFFFEIGKLIGNLHKNNIIHGDLTSSNILVINKRGKDIFNDLTELELVLIDFGLAYIDSNTEDKGVDLYVLERALLSTHSVADKMFPEIIGGYKKQYKNGSNEVLVKYEDVRARGRKRTMVG